jgi:hypothetical protein
MEIVMDIYYGFSGAIANFVVWISHFFSNEADCIQLERKDREKLEELLRGDIIEKVDEPTRW